MSPFARGFHPLKPLTRAILGIAIGALVVTACASSKKTPTAAAPTNQGAGTSAGASAAGGSATVAVKTGPMGAYLTDSAGRTLYLFAADTSTTSTCTGSCAQFWPPFTTSSPPQAHGQAQAGMLGTTKRADGTTQVTYDGHPLYYFKQDAKPGDEKGQGKNLSGGLWWLVAPAGTAITAAPSAAASSGSSGGGWS